MRIRYEVGNYAYWLEPRYTETKTGRVNILGCLLYDRGGTYKGWWEWKNIPDAVRQTVRADVRGEIKSNKRNEKYEMQTINMSKARKVDAE